MLNFLVIVVFVLIGINVSINIQNKLRVRRAEKKARVVFRELTEILEDLEQEISHCEECDTKPPTQQEITKDDIENARKEELRKKKNRERAAKRRAVMKKFRRQIKK